MPAQYFLPGKAIVQLEDGVRSALVTPWRVFRRNPAVPRTHRWSAARCGPVRSTSSERAGILAEISGIVSFGKETKGKRLWLSPR